MSRPRLSASVFSQRAFRNCRFVLLLLAFPLGALRAQHEDEDHDHLHFSHPMVTESPSPDTKVRLDYLVVRANDQADLRENVLRLEGEYAFTHSVSFAVVTPFTWRTAPPAERARGLGDIELSLKGASLLFGERGFLLGGGVSAGLPTGSDAKGIGSSHIVELEPFLDIGYKRHAFEFVSFARMSSTFRRRVGEEAERNLAFDFSGLYQVESRLEALIELTTERALVGAESGQPRTFIAPGVKVYPFTNRKIMFGTSVEIGTGDASHSYLVLLSGFYHL